MAKESKKIKDSDLWANLLNGKLPTVKMGLDFTTIATIGISFTIVFAIIIMLIILAKK